MNKKLVIISLASIIAISIGSVAVLNTNQIETKTYNPGSVPPPQPLLQILPGEPVKDLNEAKLRSGHAKITPTYLPAGYEVRKVLYIEDDRSVGMLVSKFPITDKTTDQEFTWKQGGIGIEIATLPNNFNKADQISRAISQNSKHLVMDGKDIVYHEIIEGVGADGQIAHSPAELVMFDGNTSIRISGFISSDEMIKIAQSIK